jgi:hypothetical protein
MQKISKNLIIFVLLILMSGFAYYLGSKHSSSNSDSNDSDNNDSELFVWDPPQDILMSPSTNITNSATCRFKKSFNTFFQTKITNSESNPPEKIYYDFGNENEADTVTLFDLNTDYPKVKHNNGESGLTVLNNNSDTITLIGLDGINDPINHAFSIYKLFKKKGILIYSDMADNLFLIGPTGTLEMGYCR